MKNSRRYFLDGRAKKILVAAADSIGYASLRPRREKRIDLSRVRKILLVRLDHIGDVLMTTPAIRALRKTLPAAKIHLLVKNTTREAVELNPRLDRVIAFDAPWTIARGKKATRREMLKMARRLRAEAYDLAIGFRADFREALLILATGATYRIGYGERGGGFCFTHLVPFDPGRHEILRALELLSPLGVDVDGGGMEIVLAPEDRARASYILARISREPGQRLIGIHPGAASPFKRWGTGNFRRLGDILSAQGSRVILLGATSDQPLIAEIAKGMKVKPAIVVPDGIRALAALEENLDLLIGNDSAPAHIAQAVGTRAIILYGPTHDAVTGPLDRERHTVVRQPVPCSPCWLPGGKFRCEYDFRCWKDLSVDQVVDAVAAGFSPRPGERTLKGAATPSNKQ